MRSSTKAFGALLAVSMQMVSAVFLGFVVEPYLQEWVPLAEGAWSWIIVCVVGLLWGHAIYTLVRYLLWLDK
ncbi:MAG: hypothetical protein OXT67_05890 [Zetaproteobacteria bacterium]|nr:hypothetical protein [Zetaproteobacteria bacterium]